MSRSISPAQTLIVAAATALGVGGAATVIVQHTYQDVADASVCGAGYTAMVMATILICAVFVVASVRFQMDRAARLIRLHGDVLAELTCPDQSGGSGHLRRIK